MKKLLSLVKQRMESVQIDITLKFTLSALWNLTGQSHDCMLLNQHKGSHFLTYSTWKFLSRLKYYIDWVLSNILLAVCLIYDMFCSLWMQLIWYRIYCVVRHVMWHGVYSQMSLHPPVTCSSTRAVWSCSWRCCRWCTYLPLYPEQRGSLVGWVFAHTENPVWFPSWRPIVKPILHVFMILLHNF